METFFLTGVSQGLGKALVMALLETGARVVGLGRTAPELPPPTHRFTFISLDLSQPAAATAIFKQALATESAPGKATLIHNAGEVRPIGKIGACQEGLADSLHVNFTGPFLLTEAFAAWALAQGVEGRILFISTGAARREMPFWAAYSSAKAGIDQLARCISAEQRGETNPLKVVSLAPGVIDTGMQALIRAASEMDFPGVRRFREMKAEGRLWSPAETANRIISLLQDPAFGQQVIMDLREYAP